MKNKYQVCQLGLPCPQLFHQDMYGSGVQVAAVDKTNLHSNNTVVVTGQVPPCVAPQQPGLVHLYV
jgi:hypothetical protein